MFREALARLVFSANNHTQTPIYSSSFTGI